MIATIVGCTAVTSNKNFKIWTFFTFRTLYWVFKINSKYHDVFHSRGQLYNFTENRLSHNRPCFHIDHELMVFQLWPRSIAMPRNWQQSLTTRIVDNDLPTNGCNMNHCQIVAFHCHVTVPPLKRPRRKNIFICFFIQSLEKTSHFLFSDT